MDNNVVLVDERDQQIGLMDKLEAHRKGVLHRAVSVFIFHTDGKMLLQQRAKGKYHSEGLWTNAACSHPLPDEETAVAASRRLKEEMGLETKLTPLFTFQYKAEMANGLVENEFDHVYYGITGKTPRPDPKEAQDWTYMDLIILRQMIRNHPEQFTAWFRICLEDVLSSYQSKGDIHNS